MVRISAEDVEGRKQLVPVSESLCHAISDILLEMTINQSLSDEMGKAVVEAKAIVTLHVKRGGMLLLLHHC